MTKEEEFAQMMKSLGIYINKRNQRTYKYVDVKTALKIIRNRKLLYQSPTNFNDPLDPHTSLINITALGKGSEEDRAKFTPQELKYYDDALESRADSLVKEMVGNAGILSLSKNYRNTLMWSHYADKHKGVCLGFKNLGVAEDGSGSNCFVVKYTNKVVPINYVNPVNSLINHLALLNMYCTKAKDWEYEDEVRVIDFLSNGLRPFDRDKLCELYFGVNTQQSDVVKVLNVVKAKGYTLDYVGKMKTDKSRFELDPEPIAI